LKKKNFIKTLDPDPDRYRIHPKMLDPDPDPYQMNTDPKQWYKTVKNMCVTYRVVLCVAVLAVRNGVAHGAHVVTLLFSRRTSAQH
jgi:hypothetical protein